MGSRTRFRLVVAAVALLPFLGALSGHTLEYVRLWGGAGLRAELTGSVHAYMLPAAEVLGIAGLLGAMHLWRAWTHLGRRIEHAQRSLAAALRNRPSASTPREHVPSYRSGLLALWAPGAAAQISLYLLQENLEQIHAGLPAPGIAPIVGVHWAAPFIQATVALLLAALASGLLGALRERVRVATALAAVARVLTGFLRRPAGVPTRRTRTAHSPRERFGAQFWGRPPPGLIPV